MKELILVALFALAFILDLFNVSGGSIGLVLTGGILAMVYFYVSVIIFNKIPLKGVFKKESYKGISALRILGSVGTGISLSVLLTGVVFKTMYWPSGSFMLLMGIIFCLISIVVSMVKYFAQNDAFYKRLIFRQSGWVIFSVILYVLPPYTLLNFKYKDYPAYREALINSIEHPEDDEARQKFVEEAKKLDEGR